MKVFVVYDSAAEAYGVPFFIRSTGEALRSFQTAANDGKTLISQHPDQFTLFEIGTYDEFSGEIQMHQTHKSLGKALEYVQHQSQLSGV